MTLVMTKTNSSPSSKSNILDSPFRSAEEPRSSEPAFIVGEETRHTQRRLGRLVAETLHGELSVKLRHAELERAATRALATFGLVPGNNNLKTLGVFTMTSGLVSGDDAMEVDESKGECEKEEMKGWESIQEYGKYLGETAELFRTDQTKTPPPAAGATTQPPPQTTDAHRDPSTSTFLSPIEQLQGRNSRFAKDFMDLAPLTSRENRIHAQQTINLIEWISDPQNDALFRGWSGLDQIANRPASPERERQQRESLEVEALEQILEVRDEEIKASTHGKGELGWHSVGMGERRPSSLAKYLSQDAPPSKRRRLDVGVRTATIERSRSNSAQTSVSEEDTRTVVSQDNHWRRTIFG